MFIEKCINNVVEYFRFAEGVYSKTKEDKPICKKELNYGINPLSKWNKIMIIGTNIST